jgi:hypothetical protein
MIDCVVIYFGTSQKKKKKLGKIKTKKILCDSI